MISWARSVSCIDFIFRKVVCVVVGWGFPDSSENRTKLWSETNGPIDILGSIASALLVIIRSSVFPSMCVGSITCCLSPNEDNRDLNFLASGSLILFTWTLKSPTSISLPLNGANSSNKSPSSSTNDDRFNLFSLEGGTR